MRVVVQRRASAALPLGKTRYLLYRRLGGPQDRYGRMRKNLSPHGFDPRTVQPVARSYTDWAIPAPYMELYTHTHTHTHSATLTWRPWKPVKSNSLLHSNWTYSHPRHTTTNFGGHAVALYGGLKVHACITKRVTRTYTGCFIISLPYIG
jgi:hypothetical protein